MTCTLEKALGNGTLRVWGGHAVYTVPSHTEVTRGRAERWFSRPWRPFQRMRFAPNPACPEPGSAYTHGDVLIMREEDYKAFREDLRAQQDKYGKGLVTWTMK